MENEAIEEKTQDVLKGLSSSKESISKAAKFALERRSSASEIFKGFLDRMKMIANPHHRVPLLYLLDSICQNAKARNCEEYLELTAIHIQSIARLLLPHDLDPSSSTKLINLSKKVFKIWESRGIFSPSILNPVFELIEKAEGNEKEESPSILGFDEWEQNQPNSSSSSSLSHSSLLPSSPSSKTRHSPSKRNFSSMNQNHSKEHPEDKLKFMEDYRRQTKVTRWEERLRPVDDNMHNQFIEWWKAGRMEWLDQQQKKHGMKRRKEMEKEEEEIEKTEEQLEKTTNPFHFNPFQEPSIEDRMRIRSEIRSDLLKSQEEKQKISFQSPSKLSSSTMKNAGFPKNISFSSSSLSNSGANGMEGGKGGKGGKEGKERRNENGLKSIANIVKSGKRKVFIWDLDETLIIFNSLFEDSKSNCIDAVKRRGDRDLKYAAKLGHQMEELIINILHLHLFYKQMKSVDLMRICELCDQQRFRDDPGGLSRCAREIEEIYKNYGEHRFGSGITQEMNHLYYEIDRFTDRWLSTGRNLLQLLSSNREDITNVVVTSGNLVAAVAKMIIYKLNAFVPFDNLYSSKLIGKHKCFQKIEEEYKGSSFFVVGDGKEEEEASSDLHFPFYQIVDCNDLKDLHYELQQHYSSHSLKTS